MGRKGVRIRKFYDRLMLYFGLALQIPVWISLALFYYFSIYKKMDLYVGIAVVAGALLIYELIFVLLWKRMRMNGSFLTSFKHMDYLGKMIMNNRMYVSEKVTIPNGKTRDKMIYFPKIYYKRRNGYITVRFPTDLQANQDRFLKIGANLEHAFFADMVEMVNEQDYIRYKLLYAPEKARLSVDDIQIKDGKIPLMKEYSWDYNKFPHALVSGVTGGGKSFFMMYLLKVFVELGFECEVCDFKMSDMSYFEVIPSFKGHVFDSKNGIEKCVREFREDMERRKVELKLLSKGQSGLDYRDFDMKPRALFFDEYVAYLSSLNFKESDKVMENLKQIILLGRQLGFYLIMGMQRPDAKFLPDGMRDQFGLRVSLGKLSTQGYAMMYGDTDKAFKAQPEELKGWGYSIAGGTDIHQFFAPFVTKGYDFILEVAHILGESVDASERDAQAAATADTDSTENEAI